MQHQFAIIALQAYPIAFNTGYNISKETNFAGLSCPDVGLIGAKNKEMEVLFEKCTVSVEKMLWKEADDLVIYALLWNVSKPDTR